MNYTHGILLTIVCCIIVSISCRREEKFPDEPIIKFKSFDFTDTTIIGNKVKQGLLTFTFTDGNGDIGFDTTSPRQNTIFLTKFCLKNDTLQQIETLVEMNYFVNRVFKDENPHSISGEMQVADLNEFALNFGDTIMYKFYIIDRAGNRSNIDSTGLIVVQ